MPTLIPSSILKKLYVQSSFKNTSNGYQLTLRNTIFPGTLIGFGSLQIDERVISPDRLFIVVENSTPVRAIDISAASPQRFPLNTSLTFRVEDRPLTPGAHRVKLQANTREVGEIQIDAEDTI